MNTAERRALRRASRAGRDRFDPFYRFCQWLPRTFWRVFPGLHLHGLRNVPEHGACIIVANHQSNLDPILIQATCPRIVAAMAKSTQFAVPGVGRFIRRLYAYPVRRYQVDPQSVRTTLRHLEAGRPVIIYFEGERSWDGRIQTPRLGTLRLILKAGVPVVPCAISGAYAAWPRWARLPQLRAITIRFGEPIRFPQIDDRAEREAALAETADTITAAIASCLGHHGG